MTTEFNWQATGYRVIPDRSDDYMMSPRMDVWSLPRRVACRGGKTRQLLAKRLKAENGRVTLSHGSEKQRYHIARDLFPLTFPDLIRPKSQGCCNHGHELFDRPETEVAEWGSGNRICLLCIALTDHDDTHSRHLGIRGRAYRGLPVRPAFRERHLIGELVASAHGFKITKEP